MNSRDLAQLWLMNVMLLLGYQVIDEAKPEFESMGICFGVAHAGKQAILLGDTRTFDKRIEMLREMSERLEERFNKMAAYCDDIKDEAKQKEELKKVREKLKEEFLEELPAAVRNDLLAFFDMIHLYHKPNLYRDVFDIKYRELHQDASLAAPFVMPRKLKKLGGIYSGSEFTGVYNNDELNSCFLILGEAFAKANKPLTLVLSANKHAITIGYDPEKKEWYFIDANELPTIHIPAKNIRELVDKVFTAFHVINAVVISIKLEGLKSQKDEIKELVNKIKHNDTWKKVHSTKKDLYEEDRMLWLSEAIRQGEEDVAIKLIKQGVDLEGDGNIPPAIVIAVMINASEKVMNALVKKGVDLNAPLEFKGVKITPLQLAVYQEQPDMVRFLRKEKVDINAIAGESENSDKCPPLCNAAILGNVAIIKDLIAAGANVNNVDDIGRTPVLAAVIEGHREAVALVVSANANLTQADKKGFFPLSGAADVGAFEIVKDLLETNKVDINQIDNAGTALFRAAGRGYLDIVKYLISKKVNVDQEIPGGYTALNFAISKGHLSVVNELIAAGCDVNKNAEGNTPLSVALKSGNKDIIKLLVAAGARGDEKEIAAMLAPPVLPKLQVQADVKVTVAEALTDLIKDDVIKPLHEQYAKNPQSELVSKNSAWTSLIHAINNPKNKSKNFMEVFNEWKNRINDQDGRNNNEVIFDIFPEKNKKPGFFNPKVHHETIEFIEKLFNEFGSKELGQKVQKIIQPQ